MIIGKSNATSDQLKTLHSKMADALPSLIAEIDELVIKIAAQIASLPPDRLLHRAWWEYAAVACGLGNKDSNDSEHIMALRMIDYVQSVVASATPSRTCKGDVSDEDWTLLSKDIRTLFTKLTGEYQICMTAHQRMNNPNHIMALEEFRVHAEIFWMNVRGNRYSAHEIPALLDILTPHSDIFIRLFGVDAQMIVAGLGEILNKLTHGPHEVISDMKCLHADAMERLQIIVNETGITDIKKLNNILFEDKYFSDRRDKAAGEFFGTDLFDIEKITQLPKSLIDELAWSPGEEQDFFTPGEFCGWPLRVWPTMKRPFIRTNDRTLCFDLHSLFDNIYRVLQRTIFRLAPEYKQTWNERQQSISEELPFKYFRSLLPEAKVYQSVYYRWKVNNGPLEWHEADGLIIYDDHLFVIEVKAGAFTYTSPATDLPAHIASLKTLVLNPTVQGNRFIDYLESADEVILADATHNEIGRLRHTEYRSIAVCAITLDSFTNLAARAQHLSEVGITVGQRSVWVLSIDDLRVFSDLFDNPLTFLHFVEQRIQASRSDHVDLMDEMDHLGLYFEQNNYCKFATELFGEKTSKPIFHGYSTSIDNYYFAITQDNKPTLPKQDIPHRIIEIINFLSSTEKSGRTNISSFLLNASGESRIQISDAINTLLQNTPTTKPHRSFSTYGEHSVTIWVWTPSNPRDQVVAEKHTKAVVAAHSEPNRFLLELEYSSEEILSEVHWKNISLAGLSESELISVHHAGASLRKHRVKSALKKGKIGVNDPCPCGSGSKFKKCCRP